MAEFHPHQGPHIQGTVFHWSHFPAHHLDHPRDVLVWLPPGYAEGTQRYPVLYLHDGQNKFDPTTSFAGVDWDADGAATRLIEKGEVRPFIMVAVYNSPARIAEYNPSTRAGRAYGRFLVEELMPVIDQHFRTLGGREQATMGSSMGGLISLALLWWYPDRFFGAAALSPSLWILWRTGGVVNWLRRQPAPTQPIRLYFDHGTESHEARIATHVKRTLDYIHQAAVPCETVDYFIADHGAHDETSWRARLGRPLRFLFGDGAASPQG